MRSQFARKHTFETWTEAEQIKFCEEILQAWESALRELQGLKERHDHCRAMTKQYDQERKDVEKQAVNCGIAYIHEQEFSIKAKEAYVQTRQMFNFYK